MTKQTKPALQVLIVAVPETAGSALYGMIDVLAAAGNIWQTLVGTEPASRLFEPLIVSPSREPFRCGHAIPVMPDLSVEDDPSAEIIILPEIWLGPDEQISGRYTALIEWVRRRYRAGATLYSACSGALMLAETGLLDGCEATSHWGYENLFRQCYPKVRFRPETNLAFADPAGRIVTAGGTTSWHDLALHIIARHASPGEALRIAKVYLLKWHDEGQLPFATLVRRSPHADAVVKSCEAWLSDHFREADALEKAVQQAAIPERTLKRRFKAATGTTLIERLQNIRIEQAKQLLETTSLPVDEISSEAGYEDASFFRRLFKRRTGLSPSQYRRMFQPISRM
ncbi:GlxA family transcriptional regulator [Nitrincola sp. MINF-07-Sa-05]|uniref:GlxA family transcriptional regulator n=1 Tax=Nitrincola salilacus TaxID=3400273 RepID=UPI00391842C8